MTEIQPAHFTQNVCHTAQGDRQVLTSLVCEEGVAFGSGGALEVTPGTNAGETDVDSGSAFIAGTQQTWQGHYHVTNDAPVTVNHSAPDVTDDRIDLVVARVYDSQFAGALDEWQLEVVEGSPSPSPTPPALPDNTLALAEVLVQPAGGVFTGSDITDVRTPHSTCAGLVEIVTFTASTTFEKADHPGSRYRVKVQGAGGAGGGSQGTAATGASAGSGGSGGSYAESLLEASDLSDSETVTVGSGGTPSVGLDGGDGGNSSFGTHVVAEGGNGGFVLAASSQVNFGSGTSPAFTGATVGDVRIPGGPGGGAFRFGPQNTCQGGAGGGAPMGSGGWEQNNGNSGINGHPFGGGGSGGSTRNSQGSRSGGAGADGGVVVEVYR